jgi:hypothetical protein
MKYRVIEQNKKYRMKKRQEETRTVRNRNTEKQRVVKGDMESLLFLVGNVHLICSLL